MGKNTDVKCKVVSVKLNSGLVSRDVEWGGVESGVRLAYEQRVERKMNVEWTACECCRVEDVE